MRSLQTKSQSLKGGPFRRGECHNFFVTYYAAAVEEQCMWLDFVLYSSEGNQTNSAIICGKGPISMLLPGLLLLILD